MAGAGLMLFSGATGWPGSIAALRNTVAGYYFPDGYYIPGSFGTGAGIAKWIALGFGLFTGTLLVAVSFIPRKNPGPKDTSMQALLAAIRNRGKSD
jgi:hypothetical protein